MEQIKKNPSYQEMKFILKEGQFDRTLWRDYGYCPTYLDFPYPMGNEYDVNLIGLDIDKFGDPRIPCAWMSYSAINIHNHGLGFHIHALSKIICFSLYDFDEKTQQHLKSLIEKTLL